MLLTPRVVLLAGSAAAQQITAAPNLRNALVLGANYAVNGVQLCSVAGQYLSYCIEEAGGAGNVFSVDLPGLVDCACCVSNTPAAPVYSECSSYLSEEVPELSTEYSAFGTLYRACNLEPCGSGQGAFSVPSLTATRPEPSPTTSSRPTVASSDNRVTTTSMTTIDSSATASVLPTVITSSASLSVDPGCNTMVALFSSCVSKVDNFSELPYGEQANCYCCMTRSGTTKWTNELDEAASECAAWARTAETATIYSVAKTFASFCEHFTDACDATATDDALVSQTSSAMPTTAQSTSPTTASTTDAQGAGVSLNGSWIAITAAILLTLIL